MNTVEKIKFQVIEDDQGNATGVFIPIKIWNALKKENLTLDADNNINIEKTQILQELKEAIVELKLVEQGKLKARPILELLDEL